MSKILKSIETVLIIFIAGMAILASAFIISSAVPKTETRGYVYYAFKDQYCRGELGFTKDLDSVATSSYHKIFKEVIIIER